MDIHCAFFGEENEPNITQTLYWVLKVNQKCELECSIMERKKQINIKIYSLEPHG